MSLKICQEFKIAFKFLTFFTWGKNLGYHTSWPVAKHLWKLFVICVVVVAFSIFVFMTLFLSYFILLSWFLGWSQLPPISILSSPISCQAPPSFFEISPTPLLKIKPPLQQKFSCNLPLSKSNFFQWDFLLLLIQFNNERKIADFRYFNTPLC